MQRLRELHQWCQRPAGRKAVGILGGIVCAGGGAMYLLPQGVFLDRVVQHFQFYQDGYPADLPSVLESKGRQIIEQLELKPKLKKQINFFYVFGFDVYSLGTTSTRNGAAIGIPTNYLYKSKSDVQRTEIQINNSSDCAWTSEDGENLQEAIVLSDNAQRFAIAREIYFSTYPRLHMLALETTILGAVAFSIARWGNERLGLHHRPFRWRAIWYTLSYALSWGMWASLKDSAMNYMDGQSDRKAAEIGEDYLSGGIEYYEKKMLQNRSLRTLMGTRGESLYTAQGNLNTLFRSKTMPLSQRLDLLKKLQTENRKKEEKEISSS